MQEGLTGKATATQVGGDHYKKMGAYQPWEVFAKWMTPEELKGFAKGTAIAYLAREDSKGKRQDIKKAMHTLQLYLEISGRDNDVEAAVARYLTREGLGTNYGAALNGAHGEVGK